MTEAALKLLEQVRALHPQDQRLIAEAVLDVLDADMAEYDDPMDDPEWRAEFERRLDEVKNHPEQLLDGEAVMAELRRRFGGVPS